MRLIVLKNHVPINDVTVVTPDVQEKYEIFVGRSEDCHVIIEDPLISRHHFVLTNEGEAWWVEKLTQLGVVSINGVIAPRMQVRNGDEIKCGPYSVMVSDLTPPAPAPAPVSLPDPYSFAAPVPVVAPLEELEQTIILPTEAPKPQEVYRPTEPIDASASPILDLEDLPVEEISEDVSENFPSGDDPFEELSQDDELMSFGDEEPEKVEEGITEDAATFGEELPLEDGFGGEEASTPAADDNDSTRFFKAFVNYQLVIFGDHAPYDRFLMEQEEVFIGRDPKKCQIILNDPEVSTVHAVLRKSNADMSIEDLNSSNGTILNGERINKSPLTPGDEFVIGSTSFTLEVRSDLLEAESERLMPVASGQFVETEEIHEEEILLEESDGDFSSDAPQEKSIILRIWKDPKKRKNLIYVLAAGCLIWLLLDSEEPEEPKPEAKKVAKVEKKGEKKRVQLSKELEEKRNIAYELGVSNFEQNKYFEALTQFQTVMEIDPEYKKIKTYFEQTKVGLKRLEELEAQRRAEEERIKTKKLIEELLVKAREAVEEKQVVVAESFFTQITEKDPENIEVQQLKMELEAWQKEQERLKLEQALKDAARKAMVDALQPGKTFFIKKEWYRAILKLEEFLRRKGTDEDLVTEGSEMLSKAKDELSAELGPLLGKARSLKEGQDLKGAYEAFLDVLKVEPTNAEALNEIDEIKSTLESKSKKIYREAIIAESLSLFSDAKEKFQEVQQTSPTDSEYYRKASEKLKDYLE